MVTCAMMARSLPADFARRQNGFAQFVQIGEGFQNQQIDAGFHQRLDLFAESRARFGEGGGTERFDAHAERSHGAGDKGAVLAPLRAPGARRPG